MEREAEIINMLNGSSKVVGSKQVLRGLSEGTIRCVIVSEDADGELIEALVGAAREKSAEVLFAPSMEWLGRTVGIQVGAAAAGIVKPEE